MVWISLPGQNFLNLQVWFFRKLWISAISIDSLIFLSFHRWEESKKNMEDTCSPMLQAMWDNLARASECLQSRTNIKCLHCIALSINRAISQPKHRLLSIPLSISLATSTVSYFFKCLSLEEGLWSYNSSWGIRIVSLFG